MTNIKNHYTNIKNNHLVRSSLIIFIGSIVVGFGNYLFNILMGRMLGPAEYGILASLLSLTYIISVPSQSINLVVSKYVAEMRAKLQDRKIKKFVRQIFKKTMALSFIAFLVFLSLSFFIKNFLHLDSIVPIIMLGVLFLISLISSIPMGGIRGMEKFSDISINGILATVIKLGLGVGFVYLGWRVEGALLAMTIAALITMFHLFYRLRIPGEEGEAMLDNSKILPYAVPVLFTTLGLMALYNIDVILSKHFLNAQDAGYYAALSLMGKMIFFATASIGTVLFPISAKNHSKGEDNGNILRLSIIITILVSLAITLMYFFFPQFIVELLLGKAYLPIIPYMGWIGVIFILYSLVNVLTLYNLSCSQTGIVYILTISTALEILLLSIFHSSIWEIIYTITGIMSITLTGLIVFSKYKSYRISRI